MNYLKVANFFLIFILYTSKIIRTKKENYKNKQTIAGVYSILIYSSSQLRFS